MTHHPAKFARFFIFNPLKFGLKEENDHEKLFFYYPSGRSLGEQMMEVGLSEALVQLPRTFTDDPTTSCATKMYRYLLFNPEPGWWTVLVVEHPKIVTTKGDKEEVVYFPDSLDDEPLLAMLRRAYKEFRFFNGTFEMILAEIGEKLLREFMDEKFPAYLKDIQPEKADVLSTLDGIHFLPVDKNVYLRIQSFLSYCSNGLDQIKASAFMFRNFLVWSGFEQADMRALYRWLTRPGSMINDDKTKNRGFLTGPPTDADGGSLPSFKIYLADSTSAHHLIVHQLQYCTSIFVVDPSVIGKVAFYNQLQRLIASHVEFLAPIIAEHARKVAFMEEFRYLYFNHMNLAIKTTFDRGQLQPDIIRVLNQLHSEFENAGDVEEVMVGTMSEGWVVGRKSDQREFYILFDQKSANLLEINDEVKKLTATYFRDIFMDDV